MPSSLPTSSTLNVDPAQWDLGLARGTRRFDVALWDAYLAAHRSHPQFEVGLTWKQKSMLAIESLLLMRAFALESPGAILEIGAYIGGGTLALADGARAAGGKPIVTIEVGGSHDHPTMPSRDIVADWRATLSSFGYINDVHLIIGWGNSPEVATKTLDYLGDRKIGLVVIDANGMPWDNIYFFRDALTEDCLFVFDDYCNLNNTADNVKFASTRESVDSGVAAGALERYGVAQWGTWFGRRGPAFLDFITGARLAERQRQGWRT